ncbi:hypothetical protein OEA41_009588 [Lepraria neglecta]|uniref:Uncharacterized protein n=1 Tax=Lepraria neglecta TaxID=209136 RepID=A0AAE0DH13_9LECA|nr:hypothetical protein OEA41_009588 [Lepraria neglecta]
MEHSTHAHPSPDGRDTSSREASASIHASGTITSPILASQPQNDNQQTRRLQLRNAGFRGPALPFRRISPLFGASPIALEPFSRPVNNENSPPSTEKRRLYGEDLPYKPVNILQEIHNSTRRKRASPKPSFCAIFDDVPRIKEVNENVSPTSWYNEGSHNCSPAPLNASSANMMRLREGSLNQRTPPPLSSPLAKHVKSRSLRRIELRSASSETAKYIEHLESQLASANAKLESPTATKKRSAKLRALTVENRNLRHEVSDWEKEFETRIQEEKDQRYEVDMELRQHLRQLEEEMDMKDARIGELEWELESMRVKFRDAEELEAINVSLEKRIEVLTNILVQSPMKLDASSATTSPNKADPPKRTARPRSMLPRLPSSPGGMQLSLATVSEQAFWQSKSFGLSSNIKESPEEQEVAQSDEQGFPSPTFDEAMRSPDPIRHSRQSSSFDCRSRASTSFRSAPSTSSRPSSIRSSASFGQTSWGLPDPAESEPRSASKKRRSMRRFPSGSNTLRPLILPTAAVVPSLPASAPIYPSIEATAGRDISEISLDPTTSFLSRPIDSSPMSTPTQPGRQRSCSWAQEETLRALEGNFTDAERRASTRVPRSSPSVAGEPFHEFGYIGSEKRSRRSRPRSLQKELEEAQANQLKEAQAQTDFSEALDDSLIAGHGDDGSGLILTEMDPAPSKAPIPNVSLRHRKPVADSNDTPKPDKKHLLTVLSPQAIKSLSSTPSTPEHARSIFARLTNLISRTKQDPFILARQLLANAWTLGSERLGGMGWWLLGLIYGTRWRKRKRTADSGIVEDTSTKDFDWHHFSAEASRNSAAERYYSATNARNSWLPPLKVRHNASEAHRGLPPITPSPRKEPHLFPCPDCVEPSSRRTLRLWLQFSLAIVLAVGMAIKNGPGTLLIGNPQLHKYKHELLQAQQEQRQELGREDEASQQSKYSHESNGIDSGYGSINFAEVLGPEDFEDR